ncbi:MAG: hypothetical protein FJX11_16585 [Alphaproteobacteria bacterium]|nr:hypothetical protein [Alphaproteobacteria bacterium]
MPTIPSRLLAAAFICAAATACSKPDSDAPVGPAVPRPALDLAIAYSTPEAAQRGMSDKTWLWTRSSGPAQIHYSSGDGSDFVWMVGQRRIFRGEWKAEATTDAAGNAVAQVCLRYPGVNFGGLTSTWTCQPAGTFFLEMQQREGGNPLRFAGRTQALFVLTRTPANLAEVEARVASIEGLR